jgi:amino acid transporter/mannitol/fructose-specific phosphotransferase system IIA component (Ntr-type)
MLKQDLKKTLSGLDVFCIASGAMISSGIFILPGVVFKVIGPAVFLSYMVAGIFALAGTLAIIELSTAMPRSGGDYYYIERSLGPLIGTISGFLSWFALSLKTAFALLGLAEVAHITLGIDAALCEVIATLIFVGINIIGAKEAAVFEVIMVVGLLLLLGFFVFGGLPHVTVSHFEPFLNKGCGAGTIFAVAGMVFISFGGLLNISSVSEEVRSPRRNIPLGMLASIVVVTALYVLVMIVVVGILPAEKLSASLTPLADAAKIHYGNLGYYLITIGGVLAFVTTGNAGILAASRYPLALSRDKLMPKFLSRVSGKSKTPIVSICFTGAVILLALQLDLTTLVKVASTVILLSYVLTNLAVIILRESQIQNYRPSFKMPFYPWLPFVNVIVFVFIIIEMGFAAVEIALALIGLALLMYLFFGRKVVRESALKHLIGRITNKRLDTHGLEGELSDILRQRDELVKDDFDLLVEEAPVIMFQEAMTADELFHEITEQLADELNLKPKKMFDFLQEREAESCTAISPMVAIPHIIVDRENSFKLFIIKSEEGIDFGEDYNEVKAVFVLAGSRDQRNRHLKTLAAIAQLVQHRRFDSLWQHARTEEQLRDVLLLGQRKRNV